MWKDVKGYEGMYAINEQGEVKSLERNVGFGVLKEKILKQETTRNVYKRLTFSKDNKTKRFFVHRLVYETFIGELLKGMHINHIDENKANNSVYNLNQLTSKENNHHSREKLGYKIFENDVIFIRKNKLTVKQITEKYGISPRHALRIINNERWVM